MNIQLNEYSAVSDDSKTRGSVSDDSKTRGSVSDDSKTRGSVSDDPKGFGSVDNRQIECMSRQACLTLIINKVSAIKTKIPLKLCYGITQPPV